MGVRIAAPSRDRQAAGRLDRFGPDLLALSAIAAVFVVARVFSQLQAPPADYPDTPGYDKIDFFGGALRPWPVPLLWRIVPGGVANDAYVQVLIGIAAWLFLAVTVYRLTRNRAVAIGGFTLVLLSGLGVQATEWDMVLLSESLSISLLVILIGAVMLAVDRLTPARAVGLAVALCWWAFSRPANFTILAAVFIPILVALVWTRRRDVILWVAVPLLVITVWVGYATTRDQAIWVQNAIGVIQDRLLPDPAAKEFLHDHGMPRSAVIEQQTGVPYGGYYSPLAVDKELSAWVLDRFKPTYVEYLASHPRYAVEGPLKAFPEVIGQRTNYSKAIVVLPAALELMLWPGPLTLLFMLFCSIGLGVFALARTRSFAQVGLPSVGLIIGGLWVFETWHLGVVDSIRIQVGATILIHLACVLVVIAAIDVLTTRRRAARAAAPDGAPGAEGRESPDPVVAEPTSEPAAV